MSIKEGKSNHSSYAQRMTGELYCDYNYIAPPRIQLATPRMQLAPPRILDVGWMAAALKQGSEYCLPVVCVPPVCPTHSPIFLPLAEGLAA